MSFGITFDREQQRRDGLETLKGLFQSLFRATVEAQADASLREALLLDAIDVLSNHPDFCLELFPFASDAIDDDEAVDYYIPLKILLLGGATHTMIKQLWELNTEQLQYQRDTGQVALHFACYRFQQSNNLIQEEAILALAQHSRTSGSLLATRDRFGNYPLSIALQQNLPYTLIEALMDLYPAICDGCHTDKHGSIPLGTALAYHCTPEIRQILVKRLRFTLPRSYFAQRLSLYLGIRNSGGTSRQDDGESSVVMDTQASRDILAVLLPQFKSFYLECIGWTRSGLEYFLKHFAAARSSRHTQNTFCQLTLPYDALSKDEELLSLLRDCLQAATGLGQLTLTICDRYESEANDDKESHLNNNDTNSHDNHHLHHHAPMLQAMAEGLRNNTDFRELELCKLRLPDIQSLIDFLLSDTTPKRLNLFDLQLDDNCESRYDPNRSYNTVADSRLQSLNLRNADLGSPLLDPLLQELGRLPFLQSLCLTSDVRFFRQRNGSDLREFPVITDSLTFLLERAPCLQELTLVGYVCDHARLCTALQPNATLEHLELRDNTYFSETQTHWLELVKVHNATIKTLDFANASNPKISYYLTLNQHGRVECRNPETPLGRFADILAPLVPSSSSACGHDDTTHLVYGLLREMPSIWS